MEKDSDSQNGHREVHMEQKKTTRFLWISLVELLILCVGVFGWLIFYMIKENENSISQVGQI